MTLAPVSPRFLALMLLAADPAPEASLPGAPPGEGPAAAATTDWIRPSAPGDPPTWGIRGALRWGIPADGPRPPDGPRGLIRLWSPVLPGGEYDLINFIAIEPVAAGIRGLSELEPSRLDGVPGKRLRAAGDGPAGGPAAGKLERLPSGAERLSVPVEVEGFGNGARISLVCSQRSDAPEELEIEVRLAPGSAPLERCILTATMGNKARARRIWLADGAATSRDLFGTYEGDDFTPHSFFPRKRLLRTAAGDLLAAIATDEADPSSDGLPPRSFWRYRRAPVTQYWRRPAGPGEEAVQVAVNGRRVYWASRRPIPNGVAFENFEVVEPFREGQRFVFGITRRKPEELGFSPRREG